jgi:hypothetical protein
MKLPTLQSIRKAAFTIVELVVASSVGGVVIAASLAGFVAMQRSGAIYMASSEARANQVRLVEALQRDMRNAISHTTAAGNILPISLVLPNRYSDYELTGNRAGEPRLGAAAARQPVNIVRAKNKVVNVSTVTVRYFSTSGSNQLVVHRELTWADAGGVQRTASRPIAQFAPGAQITLTDISEPISGTNPIKYKVIAATVTIRSAATTQRAGRAPTAFAMSETVFLRNKVYTR